MGARTGRADGLILLGSSSLRPGSFVRLVTVTGARDLDIPAEHDAF